jgi:hypothetical protein
VFAIKMDLTFLKSLSRLIKPPHKGPVKEG